MMQTGVRIHVYDHMCSNYTVNQSQMCLMKMKIYIYIRICMFIYMYLVKNIMYLHATLTYTIQNINVQWQCLHPCDKPIVIRKLPKKIRCHLKFFSCKKSHTNWGLQWPLVTNGKKPLGRRAISWFHRLLGLPIKRASWIQRHMTTNSKYFMTCVVSGCRRWPLRVFLDVFFVFKQTSKEFERIFRIKAHRKLGSRRGSASQGQRTQCLQRRAALKPWILKSVGSFTTTKTQDETKATGIQIACMSPACNLVLRLFWSTLCQC